MQKNKRITYPKIFWLFIIGSLAGIPMEGFWCLIKNGRWETHVVTVWEPLCIIYGFGMAGCYIASVLLDKKSIVLKFVTFSVVGSTVELICGLVLEYGLGMRAWDYSNSFMNLKGHISIGMTFVWGVFGLAFSLTIQFLDKILSILDRKLFKILCIFMSVFLAIDLAVSSVCFIRWSERHNGVLPSNQFEQVIDDTYDDAFMKNRFCEWEFIN